MSGRDCPNNPCTRTHPTVGNPAKKADLEYAFSALLKKNPNDIPLHNAALAVQLKAKNPHFTL